MRGMCRVKIRTLSLLGAEKIAFPLNLKYGRMEKLQSSLATKKISKSFNINIIHKFCVCMCVFMCMCVYMCVLYVYACVYVYVCVYVYGVCVSILTAVLIIKQSKAKFSYGFMNVLGYNVQDATLTHSQLWNDTTPPPIEMPFFIFKPYRLGAILNRLKGGTMVATFSAFCPLPNRFKNN